MNQPLEFFETPPELVRACISVLFNNFTPPTSVCDAGAGSGRWALADYGNASLAGVDNYFDGTLGYNEWFKEDFLTHKPKVPYSWVIGNPPFSLWVDFVRHGQSIITSTGLVAFIGRLNLLGTRKRYENFWPNGLVREYTLIPRPSFTGNKVTGRDMEFALYVFKAYEQIARPTIDWLEWR